tara:strand:- start:1168 stop:2094 length:927 start_codon:yes stop_codon:yes gene_type:complete
MKYVDLVLPSKNPGNRFVSVVRAWLAQDIPSGWLLNVIVVDDGSLEPLLESDDELRGEVIRLRNQVSQGRSVARNQGAAAGDGSIIIFADADCMPMSKSVVEAYVEAFESVDFGVGVLTSNGLDFWDKYFCKIAAQRKDDLSNNNIMAFTSANFAIARTLYEKVNGFDERYTAYGFEDKDFIARIDKLDVEVTVVLGAVLSHNGDTDLKVIAEKLFESGKSSSEIFLENHPLLYRRSMYYKADARFGIVPYIMVLLLGPVSDWLIGLFGRVVNSKSKYVPFRAKCWVVKFCMLLAYAKGTSAGARGVE